MASRAPDVCDHGAAERAGWDPLSGATGVADRGLVEPYVLPSVAVVVIGGTSIFGGAGGYSGTILGAQILTILAGLLTVLNAPQRPTRSSMAP
jgi:ribose/xylose/arabinose/galactoside ABC-type transport system permease subunit